MIRAALRLIAGLAFVTVSIATLVFLAVASVFLLLTFFVTWPAVRQNGNGRKVTGALELLITGLSAVHRLSR